MPFINKAGEAHSIVGTLINLNSLIIRAITALQPPLALSAKNYCHIRSMPKTPKTLKCLGFLGKNQHSFKHLTIDNQLLKIILALIHAGICPDDQKYYPTGKLPQLRAGAIFIITAEISYCPLKIDSQVHSLFIYGQMLVAGHL